MDDDEIGRILQALRNAGLHQSNAIVLTWDHGEGIARHQMVRKSSPYDESARVPTSVPLSGWVAGGRIEMKNLASRHDIVPTLCDFAGVEAPSDRGLVVRTPRYKFISFDGDPVVQLFEMEQDPGETKNLARSTARSGVLQEHPKLPIEWERGLDHAPAMPSEDAWWRRG